MARPPRIDVAGARHHVMNRGARGQPVFADDACCGTFLALVGQLPGRYGVEVHGYAVMPNHYHLMLACPVGGLSRAIQFLQGHYSRWLNREFRWDGPVWRGRYKNRVVDCDDYWRHLLAYLHLNPVAAGLADAPDAAAWTSHGAYTGESGKPDWLTTGELLESYGSVDVYEDYLRDLQLGREEGPDGFDGDNLWEARTSTVERPPDTPYFPPVPPGWPLSVEEAWEALFRVTDLERESLLAVARGPSGSAARSVTLWWLARATGATQAEIGRMLGIDASVVSRAGRRVRAGFPPDSAASAWVRRLSALFPSG